MMPFPNTHACICIVAIWMSCISCQNQISNENDPSDIPDVEDSVKESITLADPTIFRTNGHFYLYGTGAPDGFRVYESDDLEEWSGPAGYSAGLALTGENSFGTKGFWAPQVLKYGDKLVMAYTANESIAVATGTDPLGPFVQEEKQPLEAPVKQIDPFIFLDDDGKVYLYHVRLTNGNRIFVAEMKEDLSAIKPETLTECISGIDPWENTQNAPWPVTEGPTVLKHKELYYLIYSANDFRNPDYAVGFATSDSPLGPWEKSDYNPIISRELLGYNGTGHGDLFTDEQGDMQYVFHVHQSNDQVSPRRTAVVPISFESDSTDIDYLKIDVDKFRLLKR